MSYQIRDGRVIRPDQQPLKTKIVATLGSRKSYENGIVQLDGTEMDPEKIDIEMLVRNFFANGVDVIRLNLTHIDSDDIPQIYRTVKRTILECEKETGRRKRIAVLADLPGPKIRFNFKA